MQPTRKLDCGKTPTTPASSDAGFFGASNAFNGAPIFAPEQKLVPWSRRFLWRFSDPQELASDFLRKKDTRTISIGVQVIFFVLIRSYMHFVYVRK
jgi:hypothetical protein